MNSQLAEICQNCLKHFPQSKIATHFGYCKRNIKKCPKCEEIYDINFQEEHEEEFHKLSNCKYCKKGFKPNQIARHEDKCDLKTKHCEYCDLNVPMKDYIIHIKQCESRTKVCQKCRKPISNKDFILHQVQCPGEVQQIKPAIVKNKYSDYDAYIKEQQKRIDPNQNIERQYYYETKRQLPINRQRENKLQGNLISKNNALKQTEIKKQVSIPNKSNTQPKGLCYPDLNIDKNAALRGDKKVAIIPQRVEKNNQIKVQSHTNKNIGFTKIEEQRNGPLNRPAVEYQQSYKNYKNQTRKQIRGAEKGSNNGHHNQHLQEEYSRKQNIQIPSTSPYNSKKQYLPDKDVFLKKQTQKPQQNNERALNNQNEKYISRRQKQEFQKRNQERQRHIPKSNYQTNSKSPSYEGVRYYPAQQNFLNQQNAYNGNSELNDPQMDEQLQKVILQSLRKLATSSPKKSIESKPQRLDPPADQFDIDIMNQSFYDKQIAIMEDIQKNKRKK